jgi:hypothetical protein
MMSNVRLVRRGGRRGKRLAMLVASSLPRHWSVPDRINGGPSRDEALRRAGNTYISMERKFCARIRVPRTVSPIAMFG